MRTKPATDALSVPARGAAFARRVRATAAVIAFLVGAPLAASAAAVDEGAALGDATASSAPTDLRRHEYVVVVTTPDDQLDAGGRAEAAAFRAGGAVLERIIVPTDGRGTSHRMLVRTRSEAALGRVLREIRGVNGVLGATAIKLPELESGPGSPGFLSVYTAGMQGEANAGRIVPRHDVPEVIDKRDLLEVIDVPAAPTADPSAAAVDGGFSLNISELFKRLRYASWAKRERRMKERELPILPPDDEGR